MASLTDRGTTGPAEFLNIMAKKKATKRRYFGGAMKRTYRRARGFMGGGKFGPLVDGVMAGAAAQVGQAFLPGYGAAGGMAAIGWWRNNPTLMTLAGLNLSRNIPVANFIPGAGVQEGGFI